MGAGQVLRTVGEMYGPIAEKDVSGLPGPRTQHRQSTTPAVPSQSKASHQRRNHSAASASRMKRDPGRDAKGLLQEGNELQVLPFSSHLAPIRDALGYRRQTSPEPPLSSRPPTFWPQWLRATSAPRLWC